MKRKTGGQTVENQRFPTVQTPRFSVGAGCEGSSHSGLADEDIIKAFECCTTKGKSCKDCPAFAGVDRSDCKKFFLGALDLITRQKAEIEALIAGQETLQKYIAEKNAEIERLHKEVGYWEAETKEARADIDQAVAEAIKEFAERLKNKLTSCTKTIDGESEYLICDFDIDDLVKEMVGDA